jgi:hypothetical protein
MESFKSSLGYTVRPCLKKKKKEREMKKGKKEGREEGKERGRNERKEEGGKKRKEGGRKEGARYSSSYL